MKLFLPMPQEATWWIWLITAVLLSLGLAGFEPAFIIALALSAAQLLGFFWKHRSWRAIPVQIRLTYVALLAVAWMLPVPWLFWSPALGTFALVLFGYCLLARLLSLMPWNRTKPISLDLIC